MKNDSEIQNKSAEKDITIRELYPGLSEQEARDVESGLRDYVKLVLHIYEELLQNPEAYAEFKALTAPKKNSTLSEVPQNKRSIRNTCGS